MRSFRTHVSPGLAVAVVLVAVGCGDATDEAIDSERETAERVVGSTAAQWGLFTVPRGGGTPDLRPVLSPDSVVWNGSAELPVATGIWPLGDAAVLLRAESGALLRYDPVADEVDLLATLSEEATVTATGASAVVFVDSAGSFVYEVGPDYEHGYHLAVPAAWAGPIDGGLAVLTGGESSGLRLLRRADTASATEISSAGRPPALVTAWGRRIVVTGPDGRSVRVYGIDPEDGLLGEVELDGSVLALRASPSSHEIYAALETPPRIDRISRFSLEVDGSIELDEAVDRMRPGMFGGSLIVRTAGGTTRRFRTGGSTGVRLPGSWREDLPLGLPGDLSIVLVDDEARVVSVTDSAGVALAGGTPRWWLPLRFNPRTGEDADLRAALDEIGATAGAPADGGAEGDRPGAAGAGPADDMDVPQIGQDTDEAQQGPPGYYAIVASTRQRSGVEALLETLADAGYPTRVQSYPDEAGDLWHRGLVGPYATRARAQAAARQLQRERDLQAWVTEIGADR